MSTLVTPSDLRARRDTDLHAALIRREDVSQALERMGESQRPNARRRHLLGNAIRLTARAVPSLFDALRACLDVVSVDHEIELYVTPDAAIQAYCVPPERGRAMLTVSSAALEKLAADELVFLVGHELGHLALGHVDRPIHALCSQRLHPAVVLDVHAWTRAAEVSADRVGLACSRSLPAGAGLLFKCASGLSTIDAAGAVDMLAAQYDDLVASTGRRNDDDEIPHHTHPLVPIRFHALRSFHDSTHMGGELAPEGLESQCEAALELMEARYLGGDSDAAKAMRRLMFAAGIALADADGEIQDEEITALETLLDDVIDHRMLDPKAIRGQIDEHVERVIEAGATTTERRCLVRDLCLIALADDEVHAAERQILYQVAEGLGEPAAAVDAVVDRSHELD